MDTETGRAMDEWTPHRQLSLSQARARTQTVRYIRFGLVAAATMTISVFLAFIARNAYDRALSANTAISAEETFAMLNPRFTGRDADGGLYILTASSAERRRTDDNIVDLVNAKLIDAFGNEVTAPRGQFDQETEILDLFDDVLFVDVSGYVFNSTHTRVMVRTSRIIGVEPLEGTGPIGDIVADSYQFDSVSDTVTFTGGVRTWLFQGGDEEQASEDRKGTEE